MKERGDAFRMSGMHPGFEVQDRGDDSRFPLHTAEQPHGTVRMIVWLCRANRFNRENNVCSGCDAPST